MKRTRLSVLVCTLVPLMLLAAQGQVSATATPTPGLSTSVEKGGYYFAVTAFDASPAPGYSYEAEPGKRLVAVEVIIGNVSGTTIRSDEDDATLIDNEGFAYVTDSGMLNSGELERVSLNPGEKVKGWLGFVIPESATPARVKYEVHSDLVLQVAVPPALESKAQPTVPSRPGLVPPTQTPAATATPAFAAQTQQIGPIWDSLHDESFSMQITLTDVQWSGGDGYAKPKSGQVFVITYLRVKNLGPGASRSVGPLDFKVLDANGALRDDEYQTFARDCWLEFVDLIVGGSIEGCIAFEVPDTGEVSLIYAPFRYEGLRPGRYLSFTLRPGAAAATPPPEALPRPPSETGMVESLTGTVTAEALNVRSGPGADYPAIGVVHKDDLLSITGRNEDGSWLEIAKGDLAGWVSATYVSVIGDVSTLPMATSLLPISQPSSVAPATPVPLSRESAVGVEHKSAIWALKLSEVKRAKAVYFFGEATVAKGTYLIPLIEFRNDGSGTASPNYNFDFYLQDDRGRTYEFDSFGDAVLGAAWQFQMGHLYDGINPGLVLGIALPFDVPPDMGDVWLLAKQDPALVMYLGNVSQMPELR
jgi:hypothetical protein